MFGDLIVWYLFLGGAGAGLVAVLSALDLLFGLRTPAPGGTAPAWTRCLSRRLFARGYLAALAALLVGAACLLADLGQPERFYYVLVHPTSSLLTFGSYALAACALCAAMLAAVALLNLARVPLWAVRFVEVCALALGLGIMAYTGLFLTGIDFVALWRNPALPVLFVVSSLSIAAAGACGLALLESDVRPTPLVRALARTDAALVVLEAACAAVYLLIAETTQPGSAEALVSGDMAWLFWVGFAGLGLLLPLAIEIAYTRISSAALLALIVPCVLTGGFFLRYCLVNAPLW